jgi:hypothetical protein
MGVVAGFNPAFVNRVRLNRTTTLTPTDQMRLPYRYDPVLQFHEKNGI